MSDAIQVIEKEYKQADGTAIIAHMIRMGGQDYLTVAETAAAFGTTESGIRARIAEHSLDARKASDQELDTLKHLNVITFRTNTVNLLPRDTIDALLRIINSPEAKSAYRQIIGEWREAKQELGVLDRVADSLRQTADVLVTVKEDIGNLKEETTQLKQKHDALTKDLQLVSITLTEKDELNDLMLRRGRLFSRGRDSPNYYRIGFMKQYLKDYFIYFSQQKECKWYHIRRNDFEKAKELIANWTPAKRSGSGVVDGMEWRKQYK